MAEKCLARASRAWNQKCRRINVVSGSVLVSSGVLVAEGWKRGGTRMDRIWDVAKRGGVNVQRSATGNGLRVSTVDPGNREGKDGVERQNKFLSLQVRAGRDWRERQRPRNKEVVAN